MALPVLVKNQAVLGESARHWRSPSAACCRRPAGCPRPCYQWLSICIRTRKKAAEGLLIAGRRARAAGRFFAMTRTCAAPAPRSAMKPAQRDETYKL